MEPRMRGEPGYVLITVLVITAIGLLFGAGALLLYKNQCHLRIDRQHELEKLYAVRSAMNYIRTYRASAMIDKRFVYDTASGHPLKVLVQPAAAIFPNATNESHITTSNLDQGRAIVIPWRTAPPYVYASSKPSYECAILGTGATNMNFQSYVTRDGSRYGISFKEQITTNADARLLLNIGMPGTGEWLQNEYGRRYWFFREAEIGSIYATQSVVRLCLVRDVRHSHDKDDRVLIDGLNHGWPFSQKNERAIVFELTPSNNPDPGKITGDIALYEYVRENGVDKPRVPLVSLANCQYTCYMGLQIAKDSVSVFYLPQGAGGDPQTMGYVFSSVTNLSWKTYDYFTNQVSFSDGTTGAGIKYDQYGNVSETPDLRAVFEVEPGLKTSRVNGEVLTRFRVSPAYQYDVSLVYSDMLHAVPVTNRATVVQKIGEYGTGSGGSKSSAYTVIGYDTHGIEHKGYRNYENHHYEFK